MQRLCAILAAAMLMSCGIAHAEERTFYCAVSSSAYANIRLEPRDSAKIIGELDRGATYRMSQCTVGGWLRIPYRHKRGEFGWVRYEFFSIDPPVSFRDAPEARVEANGRVRLRDAPDGKRIWWLYPGAKLKVLATLPGDLVGREIWRRVRVERGIGKGKIGWVLAEYVRMEV